MEVTDSTLREVVHYLEPEIITPQLIPLGGDLRSLRSTHEQPLEDIMNLQLKSLGGDLRSILSQHTQPVEDAIGLMKMRPLDGSLNNIRIVHDTQPIEHFAVSLKLLDGDLK